jgi:hypothetical protein
MFLYLLVVRSGDEFPDRVCVGVRCKSCEGLDAGFPELWSYRSEVCMGYVASPGAVLMASVIEIAACLCIGSRRLVILIGPVWSVLVFARCEG